MRFSIRSILIVTALVAILVQPVVRFLTWDSTTRDAFGFFFAGLLRSIMMASFRRWDEIEPEWEQVIETDYIPDYLAGQVLGWTMVTLSVFFVVVAIAKLKPNRWLGSKLKRRRKTRRKPAIPAYRPGQLADRARVGRKRDRAIATAAERPRNRGPSNRRT